MRAAIFRFYSYGVTGEWGADWGVGGGWRTGGEVGRAGRGIHPAKHQIVITQRMKSDLYYATNVLAVPFPRRKLIPMAASCYWGSFFCR